MRFKSEGLKKVCAVITLIILLLVNFWIVGETAISYAMDMAKTSSENVQISAYFLDENKVEIQNKEASIVSEGESLYIKIAVKKEGYFNGKIILKEPNFDVDKENIDDGISEINENGEFVLKQINAGVDEVIELKVKPLENISIDDLEKETEIKVEGEYVNSENVDSDEAEIIKGETSINLHWVSSKNSKMKLTSEVFNNKAYNINGEEKRLVQVLVKSRISNNHYPVKSTEIKMDKIEGTEEIKVEKNGEEVKYTEENGEIIIKTKETEETKNEEQELVITYILPKDENTINKEIKIEGKLESYDEKILTSEETVNTGEEKEGTISYEIESENEIYKGKLLIGEEKEYNTKIKVKVNYVGLNDGIRIVGEKSTYDEEIEQRGQKIKEEKNAKNIYKETKINKENLLDILGEEGYLTISDEKEIVIATINKNSKIDENGLVTINYPNGIEKIIITTSKPEKTGEIEIENKKEILDIGYSREEKNSFTNINEKIVGTLGEEIESEIELKNTSTEAELEISKDKLSVIETNKNVKITVRLLNNDETKDLYQNPKLRIRLPKEVKEISARCRLLYGNGLTLGETKIIKEGEQYELDINLNGSQTTYNAKAVEGTTLIINADMKLDELAGSGEDKIELEYENEIATNYVGEGRVEVPVNIEAKVGVIATNNLEKLDVTTLGEQKNKEVKLNVSKKEREETVKINVINNEIQNIKNVKILGHFPTGKNDNLGVILTSGITTENADVKIYYSDKENANNKLEDKSNNWSEVFNPNTNKSYLIIPQNKNGMEARTRITASYTVKIPENLDYNMSAKEGYTVTYLKTGENKISGIKSTEINLTTGVGPDLDVSVKAIVGKDVVGEGKDEKEETGEKVTAGEIIKYEVTLTNNGSAPATDVEVIETVPEGTMPLEHTNKTTNALGETIESTYRFENITEKTKQEYVNEKGEKDYVNIEEAVSTVSQKIQEIGVGKTEIVEFYVRPIDSSKIYNEIDVNYNLKSKKKYITNDISNSDVDVTLLAGSIKGESGCLIKGEKYLYKLKLEGSKRLENIKISFLEQDLFEIAEVKNKNNEDISINEETGEIILPELNNDEELYIYIIPKKTTSKEKLTDIYAIVNYNDITLRSNAIKSEIKEINLQVEIQANNAGEEIKIGQEIEYTITIKNPEDGMDLDTITIKDNNLNLMTIKELFLNGNKMEKGTYKIVRTPELIEENEEVYTGDNNKTELTITTDLKAGESKILKIKCEVSDEASWITEETEIKNHAEISTDYSTNVETAEIIHIIKPIENDVYTEDYNKDDYIEDDPNNPVFPDEPTDSNDNKPSNSDVPNTPNTPNDSKDEPKEKTYTISGMAWFDENENGIKDIQEQRLSGITAKLMNLNTNEISIVTTSENGFYSFTGLKNGKYVVIFEYDTEKYMLTTYQVEGSNSGSNSDVENVVMKIDEENKKVSSTDTLEINDNSITDIDIGLVLARTFDLELTKTISRVSIINDEGTETTNYNDVTYAKAEIHAKHIEGSTVVVEYKIKVTNTGELAGYVKSIVDYKPVDLVFDSSLNNGWYLEGDNLYSNSLAETKLEVGESKELTLILTKQMTENNMGLVNNLAEIAEAETTLGIEDIDSIPGNKKRGEDDLGSSDLSIGVKTGAAVSYVIFTISSIVILLASSYLISIKIIKEKRKI